ncbi:MAG: hypothetical protein ACK5WS_05245 [Alphaproteobacteria bacterium]|jgi:hypothetical protein|nr:hypothetical protein [Candidatus Jidaibacter sp.]
MRRKPQLTVEQKQMLNDAKAIAIKATSEQQKFLFNPEDFPGITAEMLKSWTEAQPDLYKAGYWQEVGEDVPARTGGGMVFEYVDKWFPPEGKRGYNAFAALQKK